MVTLGLKCDIRHTYLTHKLGRREACFEDRKPCEKIPHWGVSNGDHRTDYHNGCLILVLNKAHFDQPLAREFEGKRIN